MKKMIALLLALVMAFALIACGGQENNQTLGNKEGSDKILIGAIYRDLTQTWFEKESTAAKATADELGIDILIGDGQEDPAVLIDVLDSFITQGIQGLVINTCDQGLSQTILDKCAAGSSLTIRPLFITYILSLSPMISGSSDDTTITEIPCAAMSRMMR